MTSLKRPVSVAALVLSMALIVTACGQAQQPQSKNRIGQSLIQSYAAAYNAHDLKTMSQLMHDDIEWINIDGSGQILVTTDKSALTSELTAYFSGNPQSDSTLSDWRVNGRYISATETVTFTRKDGSKGSQASLSVYELEDGLIRRVWYFPAE